MTAIISLKIQSDMYNPFSLLNNFAKKKLSDYWFETGTPSYLVELLKRTGYNLYDMAHTQTNADVLNSIDIVSQQSHSGHLPKRLSDN